MRTNKTRPTKGYDKKKGCVKRGQKVIIGTLK